MNCFNALRPRLSALCLVGWISLAIGEVPAAAAPPAERVSAIRLLPESTLAVLRISDVPALKEAFRNTAMGKIVADPQVQPLVGHLYGSLLSAYEQVEAQVGTSLDELLAIPQGEFCLALVAPPAGRPDVVILLDVGPQPEAADRLLQRIDDQMVNRGVSRSTEMVGDVELLIYKPPGRRQVQPTIFQKDQTIVLASNPEFCREMLPVWYGADDYRTLADNRKFATIMSRSRGSKEEAPQLIWYIDPIEIFMRLARGSLSGQAGLATLKGLGFDGLKGAGGTMLLGGDEFDVVAHSHLLLATPREGVIRMVSFGTGDLTPEPWVPDDVASYTSFYWNIDETYDELQRLFDVFRGEGAWQAEAVGPASTQLGVHLEEEVLAALDGRITLLSWMSKPARINSQTRMLGLRLRDAESFRETLQRIAEKHEALKPVSFGGVAYYEIDTGEPDEDFDHELARRPTPCLGVLDNYFLVADSVELFQHSITTRNEASRSLGSELDFKLIQSKIRRHAGQQEQQASLIMFQRPEEGFRLIYDLATAPDMRGRLASVEHPILKALNEALEENPLPPFSVLAQYLAPGGGLLIQDETGLHYTSFSLRR